ncbi:MAG: hypothetical protein ACOX8S_04580 [Christensenellales bacterium]
MSIINSYDIPGESSPSTHLKLKAAERFPEAVLVTFQQEILKRLLKINDAVQICHTCDDVDSAANEKNTAKRAVAVYKASFRGCTFAFYRSPSGAASSAAVLENVIAMGGRKFLFFGPCGILSDGINTDYIIPTAAYRAELESSNRLYSAANMKADDYIKIYTAERLSRLFDEIEAPYSLGKTWTLGKPCPDALTGIAARIAEGCIAVETECASIMETGQRHFVDIYQFLCTQHIPFDGETAPSLPCAPQKMINRLVLASLEIIRRL